MDQETRVEINAIRRELSRIPVRFGERTIVATPPDECPCNLYDCVDAVDAVVGGCEGAPKGAVLNYLLSNGPDVFNDVGLETADLSYGQATCDDGSSSSSETPADPVFCEWFGCPVELTEPDFDLGSGESPGVGVYQLKMDFTIVGAGDAATTDVNVYIIFISGDDWLDAGT